MSEREIFEFAIIGIDTEMIRAAELMKKDREVNGSQAVFICELSDKRREIGAMLKAMEDESVKIHGVPFPSHIAQEITDMKRHTRQIGQKHQECSPL